MQSKPIFIVRPSIIIQVDTMVDAPMALGTLSELVHISIELRNQKLSRSLIHSSTKLCSTALRHVCTKLCATVKVQFLPLDEAITYRAVLVVVSRSNGWVETLLEPAK